MFRKKIPVLWPLLLALVAASAVYFHVAAALLRTTDDNIAFIVKEQQGLEEYSNALARYLALHKKSYAADEAKKIRNEIRRIGDQSNLILDPELESYYAVSILFHHVPELIAQTITRQYYPAHHLDELDYAVQIVSQKNPASSQHLLRAVAQIKATIHDHNRESPSNAEAVKTLQIFSNSVTQILEHLLAKRLAKQRQQRATSLAIIIGLYVALLSTITLAVRNYVSKREVDSVHEREGLIVKLAEKNKQLECFTYAAAHDLKEPVRTIRCFTALLKKEVGTELSASATEYADVVERTAKRAEQMTHDLLSYAALSETALLPEPCDCRQEILAALEDLQSMITATKPNITIGNMPVIQTVPSLFRRVMLNLIDNAIKYTDKGCAPEIHIATERQREGWLFAIKDCGIGIDTAHRQSVFEPFKRLYPDIYRQGEGFGLTSCKKIVEMLGGRIWLESEPGSGTTAFFTLPADNKFS